MFLRNTTCHNSLNFVFHGGSGSTAQEIKDSVSYGVVKMNIDTDTQWATWEGVINYYKANEAYLQGQLGNPKGEDQPNKKCSRSARMAACRSDFDDRSSGKSIPGTERDRRSVRYSFLLISRPALRVFFRQKAKLPDALRLSGLHLSCNILNLQVFCRPDKAFTPHPA